MRFRMLAGVAICVALALPQVVKADALAEAGLVRAGSLYVLPDDAAVVDGIKSLRQTKLEADRESRSRHMIETQLATKRKAVEDDGKQWVALQTRLSLVQDVGVHNRIVLRMNRLVADQKQAIEAQKDLEEQAGKVSTKANTQYVDDLAALNTKANAVSERYKSLSNDAAVKNAINTINSAAAEKVALGPTAEFVRDFADLMKWQSAVETEAIPLIENHGVHMVDALLDGEHFVMGVDTGASAVALSHEVAEKLNMSPGEQDPTVQIQLADGNIIEGKQMSLKSVRVGRFTIPNVTCIVLQKGLTDAPLLLGGSFLNHFIVRLDPGANELHLTEIKDETAVRASHPLARPAPSLDSN